MKAMLFKHADNLTFDILYLFLAEKHFEIESHKTHTRSQTLKYSIIQFNVRLLSFSRMCVRFCHFNHLNLRFDIVYKYIQLNRKMLLIRYRIDRIIVTNNVSHLKRARQVLIFLVD